MKTPVSAEKYLLYLPYDSKYIKKEYISSKLLKKFKTMFPINFWRKCLRSIFPLTIFTIILLMVGKNSWNLNNANAPLQKITPKTYLFPIKKPFYHRTLNFSVHSAPPCRSEFPYLLAIVHSSPSHYMHRSTIRKTWGSQSFIAGNKVRVVFLVGQTESRIQTRLNHEMKTFNDIVQGNFVDSYKNLTYKHIMGYKWVLSHCEQAAFVMKADDDVFIDVIRAVTLLIKTFGTQPQNTLACLIVPPGSSPKVSGKWAVSKGEYPLETYPEYCSGMVYFVTPDIMQEILVTSQHQPFFWIDDIFVTGMVAQSAQVKRTDFSVWFARSEHLVLSWLAGNSSRPCPWLASELLPQHWPQDARQLWSKTLKAWKTKSSLENTKYLNL